MKVIYKIYIAKYVKKIFYLCPCEQYVIKFFYVVASKATILKVCAEPLGFSDPRTALC